MSSKDVNVLIAAIKQYCLQTMSKHSQWWRGGHIRRQSISDTGAGNWKGSCSNCRQMVWRHVELVSRRQSSEPTPSRHIGVTGEMWQQVRWLSAIKTTNTYYQGIKNVFKAQPCWFLFLFFFELRFFPMDKWVASSRDELNIINCTFGCTFCCLVSLQNCVNFTLTELRFVIIYNNNRLLWQVAAEHTIWQITLKQLYTL